MRILFFIPLILVRFGCSKVPDEMYCDICEKRLEAEKTVFTWDDHSRYNQKQYVKDRADRFKTPSDDILYDYLYGQSIFFFCSDSCADIWIARISPKYDSLFKKNPYDPTKPTKTDHSEWDSIVKEHKIKVH